MLVRDAKRRGEGWLAGSADIGWSNRLGWYEGFRLLVAVDPTGVVTGFGFCAASTADQQVAETFFAVRHQPNHRLASVGSAFSSGPYVADKGFEGEENHRRWLDCYGVRVIYSPKRNSPKPWSKRLRRWLAGIRQIVETVYDKLFNTFGLHTGASTRTERLAGSSGDEGGAAQLLHLAQRATWTPLVGFRRLAGMVISTHTKRLR